MSPRARWIVIAFALAGLGFATGSTWVHYQLLTNPNYTSPCDINATFNCSQAYLSKYGSIRGVPVALGGVIWFALVAVIAGWSRPATKGDRAPHPGGAYIFALSTIGLATVLYLGYASFAVLKTACLLCMGTYVCVLGIFITSGLTNTMSIMRLPSQLLADLRTGIRRPVLLLTAALFITASASSIAFFPREGAMQAQAAAPPQALPAEYEKEFTEAWAKQPRVDLGIPADGAKVVIVKFNDWLCPQCKLSHQFYEPVYARFKTSNPGAIKVVIKDWPWNSECNMPNKDISGHEGSCVAAAAVRMARDRGKADAMISWILTNQTMLIDMGRSRQDVRTFIKKQAATQLGLADYDKEYAIKLPEIRRDVADGVALNIEGTPTFFINGVRVPFLDPSVFDLAIRIELGKGPGK